MNIDTQTIAAREQVAAAQAKPEKTASVTELKTSTERQAAAEVVKVLPGGAEGGASSVAPETLDAAVRDINDYVQRVQRTLQFSVDDDTGTTVVKVLDSQTDEVVRQFPPEEALALARHLQASQETQAIENNGLILQARA